MVRVQEISPGGRLYDLPIHNDAADGRVMPYNTRSLYGFARTYGPRMVDVAVAEAARQYQRYLSRSERESDRRNAPRRVSTRAPSRAPTKAPSLKQSNKPKDNMPKRGRSIVRPQGDSEGSYRVSRKKYKRKKRKMSLKRKVAKLSSKVHGLQPETKSQLKQQTPLLLENAGTDPFSTPVNNYAQLSWIELFNTTVVENTINAMPNYTSSEGDTRDMGVMNSTIPLTGIFVQVVLKNFSNSNCTIKYQYLQCKEEGSDDPLDNISEYNTDRGLSYPSKLSKISASASTAESPAAYPLDIAASENMGTIFGIQSSKWKPMHAVKQTVLGPGDTITISQKIAKHMYKPELRDQDAGAVQPRDVGLLLYQEGDYGMQSTGNPNVVGKVRTRLVGSKYVSFVASFQNGEGRNRYKFASAYDSTNFTSPTVISNQDPTVENYSA